MTPLVLAAIDLGLGVLLSLLLNNVINPLWGLIGALLFLLAAIAAYVGGRRETPALLLGCLFCLGLLLASCSRPVVPAGLGPLLGHYVTMSGTLAQQPSVYDDRTVYVLKDPVLQLGSEAWSGKASGTRIQAVCYNPVTTADKDPDKSTGEPGASARGSPAAAGVRMPLPGDHLLVKGKLNLPPVAADPGDFDYRAYLLRHGVAAELLGGQSPALQAGAPGLVWYPLRFAAALHLRLEQSLRAALPADQASFLSAMLLGARAWMTPEDKDLYQRTGVMHLFVVSGLHLGFVLAFFLILARLLRLGRGATFTLVGLAIWAYAALIGLPTPVIRAAVMGTIALAGSLWKQTRHSPLNSLAIAALAIILANPLLLQDPGFQFTLAASWGIISLSAPLARFLPGWPGLKQLMAVALAAQLSVLPLTALYFQQIPVLGLLANILVVPLAGLAVNLGLAGMLLTLLYQGLGSPFFLAAGALTVPLQSLLGLIGRLPAAALPTTVPPLWLITAWYLLLTLLGWSALQGYQVPFAHFRFRAPARRWLGPACAGLVLAAVFMVWGTGGVFASGAGTLRVTFINVGQGDSILVEAPNGHRMLIDAGGKPAYSQSSFDPGAQIVVPYLAHSGIRSLDLVVNTHPHEDHLGGLPAVVSHLPVGAVIMANIASPTPLLYQFEGLLRAKGVPTCLVASGADIHLDPHLQINVLNPPAHLYEGTRSDLNNNSIVMQIRYGQVVFLLTGDAEEEALSNLAAAVPVAGSPVADLRADVLKAPHHGSATSTDAGFAKLVAPRFVVISVGRNSFGHPAPETLKFWRDRGATVLRTDEAGAIIFETDGERLSLKTPAPQSSQVAISAS